MTCLASSCDRRAWPRTRGREPRDLLQMSQVLRSTWLDATNTLPQSRDFNDVPYDAAEGDFCHRRLLVGCTAPDNRAPKMVRR